ncbi:putative F-box/FBD/LRR-repeat protein [Panicum miliaceum]|uniref:F-box/FBD/LRR-repeat protein n=1 Tax=Panicum miliaceum TaxID=4540 RepID=A0A3L6Q2K6_PANMI|nr:putative F-box/FBD/LRR-repeat protein [Panicum miliaceum]
MTQVDSGTCGGSVRRMAGDGELQNRFASWRLQLGKRVCAGERIALPTLRTLVVDGGRNIYDCALVVLTPSVASLHLAVRADRFYGGISIDQMPSLVKASIHLRGHRHSVFDNGELGGDQFKLLCSISSATTLELSGLGRTVLGEKPTFQEFVNLRNLLLDKCDLKNDFRTLGFFLQSSPNLEKLTLRHCKFPSYRKKKKGDPKLNKSSSSEFRGLDFMCANLKVEIICSNGDARELVKVMQAYALSTTTAVASAPGNHPAAVHDYSDSDIESYDDSDDDNDDSNDNSEREWEDFEDFAENLMHRCNVAQLDSLRLRVNRGRAPTFADRQAGGWLRRAMKYCNPDPPRQREGLSSNSWRLKRLYLCNVALENRFAEHVSSVCHSLEDLELEDCGCGIQSITSHSLKKLVLKNCRWRYLSEITSPTLKSLVISGGSNTDECVLVIVAPAIAHLCLDVSLRFARLYLPSGLDVQCENLKLTEIIYEEMMSANWSRGFVLTEKRTAGSGNWASIEPIRPFWLRFSREEQSAVQPLVDWQQAMSNAGTARSLRHVHIAPRWASRAGD